METSVKLQEPFSYAVWPIIVVGMIAAAVLAYLIIEKLIAGSKKKRNTELPVVRQKSVVEVSAIKRKYIAELYKIENDLKNSKISIRTAYQKMSVCIRKFVYEVTGIKVQHYTLFDIKALNMPMLEDLIAEYYAPEFSEKSVGDVSASIEKTKRVIEKWN